MTRPLNRNQGELFEGPEIAGKRYAPTHANWLKREAVPKVLALITELGDAGEMPPELARQTRHGLLHARRKLAGEPK
jgi:hypothetical protein